MILDKLLKKKEESSVVESPDDKIEKEVERITQDPEETTQFKLRMFSLMLQALYNSTTVLKAVLHGDDWEIHGDPVTSSIIDGDLIINTLKKFGMYARYPMKSFEDGTKGLKWLRKSVIDGLKEEFYEMEYCRDGKIFMLDEKIASLQRKNEELSRENEDLKAKLVQLEGAYTRSYTSAQEVVDKCKEDTRCAYEGLKSLSSGLEPEQISSIIKECLRKLRSAASYQISSKYEQAVDKIHEDKENEGRNTTDHDSDSDSETGGPTAEEAEKAVEDYYNRELQGSKGSEG